MAKYRQRKITRYYARKGRPGRNRSNYRFKQVGLDNMYTKRKIEWDYTISINNQVPVFGTTFASANILEDVSNAQPEWANLFSAFRYYRIRGVSVEWVPNAINTVPFSAMVFPTHITPAVAINAITADNRLNCDGVIGKRQKRYYDFQGASFSSDRGYITGGPVWNLTDHFDHTSYRIILLLGSQLPSTQPTGTVIGAMRIKLYIDFCYANVN